MAGGWLRIRDYRRGCDDAFEVTGAAEKSRAGITEQSRALGRNEIRVTRQVEKKLHRFVVVRAATDDARHVMRFVVDDLVAKKSHCAVGFP